MSEPKLVTRTIIGLEIHVQLNTKTKMFCGCPVRYDAPPNSCVCPVCLGHPGALPVINRRAFGYAVLTGLALNCKIAGHTKWDRKSYYYPDLPKNYQISQYDLPLAARGFFEIPVRGRMKRVRITRAHLEEDAGKTAHYMLRWVATTGEKGPWSETATATVGAQPRISRSITQVSLALDRLHLSGRTAAAQ